MKVEKALVSLYAKVWDYSYIILPAMAWGIWGFVGMVLFIFAIWTAEYLGAFKKFNGLYLVAVISALALQTALTSIYTFTFAPMSWVLAGIYLFIAHVILQTPKEAIEPTEVK